MKKPSFLLLFMLACSFLANFTFAQTGDIKLSVGSISLPIEGGTKQITVTAPGYWRVSNAPGWCTVTPNTGNAGATVVTITTTANTGSATRKVTLQFAPKNGKIAKCDVSQDFFQLSASNSIKFASNGGEQFFIITSAAPWTVTAKPSWASLPNNSGPAGTTVIRVQAGSNAREWRSGNIVISSGPRVIEVNVGQTAKSNYGATSLLTISPRINADASAQTVYLNAYAEECTWTITQYPSWMSFNETNGSGSKIIEITLQANTSPNPRNVTLNFKASGFMYKQDEYVSVTQAGKK